GFQAFGHSRCDGPMAVAGQAVAEWKNPTS
ncbi:MAG: hypothetical protein ACI97B_002242, partial [Verrucomicrobiales bacterium]